MGAFSHVSSTQQIQLMSEPGMMGETTTKKSRSSHRGHSPIQYRSSSANPNASRRKEKDVHTDRRPEWNKDFNQQNGSLRRKSSSKHNLLTNSRSQHNSAHRHHKQGCSKKNLLKDESRQSIKEERGKGFRQPCYEKFSNIENNQ